MNKLLLLIVIIPFSCTAMQKEILNETEKEAFKIKTLEREIARDLREFDIKKLRLVIEITALEKDIAFCEQHGKDMTISKNMLKEVQKNLNQLNDATHQFK